MYGQILRQLRETKGRSQAHVARSVGISPAQLARLEANQRGLYLDDFVRIVETLGEKPGNLLPSDLGDIARLKPLIDLLVPLGPPMLARIETIVEQLVLIAQDAAPAKPAPKKRKHPAAR